MKYIQTHILKILLLIVFAFASFEYAQAQGALARADSLFRAKQYTQSFELYQLFYASNKYSPAMFLKMAYIQEGLGHISQSIYYLKLYHQVSGDEQALNKISELATKNKLEGYSASLDHTFFRNLLDKFSAHVSGILLAFALFFFAIAFYLKRKKNKSPLWAAFSMLVFLGLLFVQTNFIVDTAKGIVSQSSTYLMSGPSAGASVMAVIGSGHQLAITGRKDVWLRVEWAGQEAFVKEDKLLQIDI
jgi:hypothetical protein